MYYGCFGIKLSSSLTGNYTEAYRLPPTGSASLGTNSLINMFYYTGGTWTGTPGVNTTYYLDVT